MTPAWKTANPWQWYDIRYIDTWDLYWRTQDVDAIVQWQERYKNTTDLFVIMPMIGIAPAIIPDDVIG